MGFPTTQYLDEATAIDVGRGRMRAITGTDPAAGAESSETVPTGKLWVLHSWFASLVTDINVANRIFQLVLTDSAIQVAVLQTQLVQVAGQTVRYLLMAGLGYERVAAVNARLLVGLPLIVLSAGATITTSTSAIQVGDNWTAPNLRVQEFDI